MPHWRKMIDRDFLASWDLLDDKTGKHREVTVTVESIEQGRIQQQGGTGKARRWPILKFKGHEKRFIAKFTNCTTIESLYGTQTEGWVGKRLTLIVVKCEAFKKLVDGIRVKPEIPGAKTADTAEQQQPVTVEAELKGNPQVKP